MKRSIFYIGVGLSIASSLFAQKKNEKPNVLFIAIDDLRPELNCYGADYMHTPNIDRLAAKGTLFQQAYCQQAISSASRNSLLTGYRPDGIGIYDLATFFRTNVPDVVALPQHFKNNGYRTETVGKIYHVGNGNQDDNLSWTVPKWTPNKELGNLEKISNGDTTNLEGNPQIDNLLLPYFASNIPTENMTDARVATVALQRMKAIKDEPFFLAVGFVKPHLPFVAPKKYWNLYDENDIVIPKREKPEGIPSMSLPTFSELRAYHNMPSKGFLNDQDTKALIHGYRACVSFVDEQVGRLLDALEENGLADNTIIVLWGDHGWKLGEYGNWCKHSNMEFDTQAPLIITAPGYQENQKTKSLVEFVDIYPTLCDLAGLEKPNHLQGQSMLPILENPNYETKNVAISQYPRGDNMGYSMRTDKYRYTRWIKFNSPNREVVARELYDHSNGKLADKNLANDPNYKNQVDQLDKLLTFELGKYSTHSSVKNTVTTGYMDNIYFKNDFTHGIEIGESIEKGDYNEDSSFQPNQWNLSNANNTQGGSSPTATSPLNYDGYIESGSSNAFRLNKLTSGSRVSTYSLNTESTALKYYNNGSFYLSFMIKVNEVTATTGVGVINLDGSHLGNFRRTALFVKKINDKKFTFGLAYSESASDANPTYTNTNYDIDSTYLVIIKHNFDTAPKEEISLFINPDLNSQIEPTALISYAPTIQPLLEHKGIRAISVRQRTNYSATIGGMRFTKSWKAIINVDNPLSDSDGQPHPMKSYDYADIAPHPRLLLSENDKILLKQNLTLNSDLKNIHDKIISEANKIAITDPVQRVLTGKRLLSVSRTALKRIFYLSYAYRLTQNLHFAIRAEEEILAVCNFSDWNPSHFLDVAEMSMGVAIGYDWLYDILSTDTKDVIREALISKAFSPSKINSYNWFLNNEANWNQVCNAGLTYAALAIYDGAKDVAVEMIERAIEFIKLPLKAYGPDGNYSEGYMYWGYGTTFQVMMLAALESALGSDLDLHLTKGFMESGEYIMYMTSPTGLCFNYSDCSAKQRPLPSLFWFAQKSKNSSLIYDEIKMIQNGSYTKSFGEDRVLPITLIFANHASFEEVYPPLKKIWVGNGTTPVALIRTDWDDTKAKYLGIKAGKASTSHAHMDAGSFVYDANNIRWAVDLGMQSYEPLESKGIDLWNMNQNSQRWDVFRLNNKAHNTITINNERHLVSGMATIEEIYDTDESRGAKINLKPIFGNSIQNAYRTLTIENNNYLLINDVLQTGNQNIDLEWRMLTSATPTIDDTESIIYLEQDDKKTRVKIESTTPITLKTWPANTTTDYDEENIGVSIIGFECVLPKSKTNQFKVYIGNDDDSMGTNINNNIYSKEIIQSSFFTLTGLQILKPDIPGLYINKKIFSDGSTSSDYYFKK